MGQESQFPIITILLIDPQNLAYLEYGIRTLIEDTCMYKYKSTNP